MEIFEPLQEDTILKEYIDLELAGLITGIAGSAIVLVNFALFLIQTADMKDSFKVDSKLSKRINGILNTTEWKVHIVKEKQPNAFAINGPHVFVTTGLIKLATENELTAILLHEVYHTKFNHSYKQLAYKYPLFYLCVFVAVTIGMALNTSLFLAFLIFRLINLISDIPYKIIIGRMHENKADNYAIQLGYGKDLVSILKKLEKIYIASMKDCTGACKVINAMDEALDEHPPLKKRIEIVLKKTDELQSVLATKNIKSVVKFIIGTPRENGQTPK
jgi:Zn-dependent protease with chaperone function